jgi:outer membrane protein assembly factor BamB
MRRICSALGAVTLTILLAGCWEMPGQNVDRTGFNAFESTISPANAATLTQRWAYPATPTGRPIQDPAVSSGGVHVSTGGCAITTVDPATGALRWTAAPIPQACSIPPTLGGLGTHEPWVDGDVVHVGWESFVLSAPGPPRPPSYDSGTDSFDVETGAPAGHLSDGVLDTRRGLTIGTTRGAVDANGSITYTGNLRHLEGDAGFTFPGQTMKRATVGTFGTPVLFVGANGSVQAYPTSANDGGCGPGYPTACLGWETPVDGQATRPVLEGAGHKLYVATSGGTVYRLDGNGGGIEWSGALGAPAAAAPALADGVLYVPTTAGDLVAFAADGCDGPSTCAPLWSASAGSPITKPPAVGGGVVFTGSADGSLHGFAAAGCGSVTCPALWTGTTDGSAISGGPVVTGGRVYAGTTNGQLFAFGLP